MLKSQKHNLILERILGIVSAVIIAISLLFISIIFFIPINNYHHSQGTVEYKYQYKIVSQIEGVLEEVFVPNYEFVNKHDSLFRYASNTNNQEVLFLEIRERHLKKEVNILQRLFKSGSLSKSKLNEKVLTLNEVTVKKEFFRKNIIYSPDSGKILFSINPETIKGTYITKGETLAYLFYNEDKHIRISFPNMYADRFKIGSKVIIKFKDPSSFKIRKLTGNIYKTFVNIKDSKIDLFCNITGQKDQLKTLKPFTVVNTSVLINSNSIIEDLFSIKFETSKVK